MQIGDIVKIVGHKFPELHPKNTLQKVVMKTPEELKMIHHKCKKPDDPEMSFSKNSLFEYELKGINYIGMTGVIVEIRTQPECEYETETGDIAKYVVKIKSNLSSWNNKIVTLYPSQVQKIEETFWLVEPNKDKKGNIRKKAILIAQKKLF
ncbi:hypothetical protein A2W67_02595 [Candidatus Nomurabacteria bacterium RIFCSPLOWO2_02_40_28]|uniref:Uncharacterized protein n=2 Tax=Candidatus Nomuraibacteriota TaxID=1752729 RepID=A0A837HVU1_9BACT|nr:MAG: hypothetical protein UT27_C0007G0026 [Candidatus Nomurabacteria bacterium GW2011_GWD2_39_12]KKR20371.1 MAG: hypothetical protein UT51_C0004G0030 [Candidatus Nomurabacteria bacterium GW2011_GWC2_39_41]KKR37088.1 MAG: hypothetical protein UT70_C0003G0030 [Candidatus Nomurabacteria bacterium GW2011_GWE2_40_10]KKR38301.1 MAG: hypothetical protein UT73_C0004G0046 [Candidatus Nomurabacteria bacterium GW2011_GWB1_40_11]KKR39813.1 MAG: hypothetical protein UT74_C0005G0030 [Parcubacteria group b